ncbi:MAG: primase-like DNA-binding domain-containing protein [Candidatus Izemoplasmatales bacterium]|jgi:hypothetical protein|nr:primase-like DNA-binding domain-containing protein [Candidatus Izemoplasmatales bacterium]MDD3865952.1 primase-like DNA-binding domain-containing protein [Candidatus Izemoplasmatales bacterium]
MNRSTIKENISMILGINWDVEKDKIVLDHENNLAITIENQEVGLSFLSEEVLFQYFNYSDEESITNGILFYLFRLINSKVVFKYFFVNNHIIRHYVYLCKDNKKERILTSRHLFSYKAWFRKTNIKETIISFHGVNDFAQRLSKHFQKTAL